LCKLMAKISFLFDGRKKKKHNNKITSFFKSQSVGQLVPVQRESDFYHTPSSIEIKEITCMQTSTLNEEGRKEGRRKKKKRKPNQPSVFYPPSVV
jgi:hypothetical protein